MQRNLYFDALRGIAILMVVAIHTFNVCEFDSFVNVTSIGVRQIFNIAVPLFLAISGFFIGKKQLENKEQIFSFWKKQIPKVYIPVLVWSLPYLGIAFYTGKPLLQSVALSFICGYSVYYFVALIIQCYLILPFLQKYTLKINIGGIFFCVSLICIIAIAYLGFNRLPLILYAGPVVVWLTFFWLGVYLSKNNRDYNICWITLGLVVSYALMIIETYYIHEKTGGGGYGIKPSSFLFSFLIILLLFSKRIESHYKTDCIVNKVLTVISDYSFPIYLLHCFVIAFVSHFISISFWIIRWAIVVAITMLIVYTARKVLPKKLLKIIGF